MRRERSLLQKPRRTHANKGDGKRILLKSAESYFPHKSADEGIIEKKTRQTSQNQNQIIPLKEPSPFQTDSSAGLKGVDNDANSGHKKT